NGTEKAILGSSNFTLRGLGFAKNPNFELNLIVDSDRDRRDLKDWFDALWNDEKCVVDVTAEVLRYLEEVYKPTPPEFIYFKTLYHLFKQFIEDQNAEQLGINTHFFDTQIWQKLYAFQKDGVKNAITKLNKHNGCILADSVGLGKTFEALAVIKYFENLNYNVLVLCPKKLRQNWTKYNNSADKYNPFTQDRFRYIVLSHTDLSRDTGRVGDIDLATFNWGNFDLVVIDESHNFRNTGTRHKRLLENIIKKSGTVKTKVLLLSATPVNTDLSDLRNQLAFFTEGQDNAFQQKIGIRSVRDTLKSAQNCFKDWANSAGKVEKNVLLERLGSDFFKLLDELTIARSRRHIEQYYQATLAELGQFPERLRPENISAEIDKQKQFMSYKAINDKISQYKLAIFNPSAYVKSEFFIHYKIKQVQQREHYLVGMMKVNFMKRLESSVHSFTLTLERTIKKIGELEDKLRNRRKFDFDDPLDFTEEDEELEDAFQIIRQGKKIDPAHLDIATWLKDLREDRQQLESVYQAAEKITVERDAKLAKLKELIGNKVQNPTVNTKNELNRKVLVFTAFADTAKYLYNHLETWATSKLKINIALVTGSDHKTTLGRGNFEEILTHFSPRSKERHGTETQEINLLIATDCISEGQNLQDCDYLINYDIHWNPVRIIQRFGRIDRLNSLNKTVQLVNFWPTPDLDDYLNLKNRVEARMALVDVTATAEDNLLAQEKETVQRELTFRDEQFKRLQKEILDLEDFNENVTLNEFTLDDFRMELDDYLKKQERTLQEAPLGLYAVVPPYDKDNWQIAPGVIFCLAAKEVEKTTKPQKINPLYPFFLVYVLANGEIKYSFTHPKEILLIFQKLCIGKKEAYRNLCHLFDEETDNGKEMRIYNELLKEAVNSIVNLFEKRNVADLFTGRSGKLLDVQQQVKSQTDFMLVSWLVIKK
ncbi:MAG: ATP-dependent helicase, partial [Beggiatoa sp. IS2]